MGNTIVWGTESTYSGITTANLIARVRDLVGEETSDLYDDDTEILPALNDGKNVLFASMDVLLSTLTRALASGTSAYEVADLGRVVWLKHRTGSAGAYSYTDILPISSEHVQSVIDITGSTPLYFTTDIPSSDGTPQVTVYPTPGASITGEIYGLYYAVPTDLDLVSVNPRWHARFHFLPCYHAAAVLLRKDRRPEAALEMETLFKAGMVEYERWYNSRRPAGQDVIRSQPSPNDAFYSQSAYPYEIG